MVDFKYEKCDIDRQSLSSSTSLSSCANQLSPTVQEQWLRKKLEWYFKTPFDKYRTKGRKPLKFLLQVIKIVVITVQSTLFASDEFSIVNFNNDNLETFRDQFILGYNGMSSSNLYTKDSVYQHMFHAWKQYYNIDSITAGSYKRLHNDASFNQIYFCKTWDDKLRQLLQLHVYQGPHDLGQHVSIRKSHCYHFNPPAVLFNSTSLSEFIEENHLPEKLGWVIEMKMQFSFQLNYSVVHGQKSADLYRFDVVIYFDNSDLDGTMTVSLNSEVSLITCCKTTNFHQLNKFKIAETVFDFIVILICLLSSWFCIFSFMEHFRVCREAEIFFREYLHEELTFSDKTIFINFWLIIMLVSDLCAIAASAMKISFDWFDYIAFFAPISLCFGISVLFAWVGILRFLGCMEGYNALLVTLKVAFPSIIRFICCVLFIYVGFVICGWIVFGPYHQKFSGLLVTSECLFSLINGDDLYRTFTLMTDVSPLILYFCKIYLYIYNSLFIFVILSLFIGIVSDNYHIIKNGPSTTI